MNTDRHAKAAVNTTSTQFAIKHELSGKVAGYDNEKLMAINDWIGKDLILIAQHPNGMRTVYGTILKPMRMEISIDEGGGGNQYVGSDIKFTQVDFVDFLPPILNNSAIVSLAIVSAVYS